MDDNFFSSPEEESLARLRSLASKVADGNPYTRWPDIQAEIQRLMRLPQSNWVAEANDVENETLVFLIRQVRNGDQRVYGALYQELSRRTMRIAKQYVRELDGPDAEHIMLQVEMKVCESVLANDPKRRDDFLEVTFGKAVEQIATDFLRKHNRSALAHRGEIAIPENLDGLDDTEEVERPIEFATETRPDPEASFRETERKEWLERAYAAITDPLRREAVILHYKEGWPIESADPDVEDLVSHFGVTRRRVKYWLACGKKEMETFLAHATAGGKR